MPFSESKYISLVAASCISVVLMCTLFQSITWLATMYRANFHTGKTVYHYRKFDFNRRISLFLSLVTTSQALITVLIGGAFSWLSCLLVIVQIWQKRNHIGYNRVCLCKCIMQYDTRLFVSPLVCKYDIANMFSHCFLFHSVHTYIIVYVLIYRFLILYSS